MRVLFALIVLSLTIPALAGDANRAVCVKGFERLVLLSNANEISPAGFDEAVMIADTLLCNKCYEYVVDRRGTIYAGASLSYIFGKICAIKNDTAAIRLYITYMGKTTDSADGELYTSLESLFYRNPELFLDYINKSGNDGLLYPIAMGFIDNMYEVSYTRVNRENYKTLFYKRYATLKNNVELQSIITSLLSEIERALE